MNPIYLHDWAKGGRAEMLKDFSIDETALAGMEVLFADYSIDGYDGTAFVLLRRTDDDTLWEVNGSHCSCYGLEDEWRLESTSVESLTHRLDEGTLGKGYYVGDGFADELRAVLAQLPR